MKIRFVLPMLAIACGSEPSTINDRVLVPAGCTPEQVATRSCVFGDPLEPTNDPAYGEAHIAEWAALPCDRSCTLADGKYDHVACSSMHENHHLFFLSCSEPRALVLDIH